GCCSFCNVSSQPFRAIPGIPIANECAHLIRNRQGRLEAMADDSLSRAKDAFDEGKYSECLQIVQRLSPRTKSGRAERDCLLSECLLFTGQLEKALAQAEAGLASEPST